MVSRLGVPVVALAVAAAVAVTACGDEVEQVCVTEGDAELCLERDGGAATLSGEGLEPGSDLVVSSPETGSTTYTVGDDGTPDGLIGFLGDDAGEPVEVDVAGVTASGATIDGTLRLG